YFRDVATSSSGTTTGAKLTFKTPPSTPSIPTLAASGFAYTGATLNGTANPNGLATTVHFEYGLTAAYGTSTANQNVGAGTSAVAVQAVISGLALNTIYHYRIVGTSSGGTR